jgi:hypothetical protein
MTRDMRRYNGGARKGAGRPKTVGGWHQVAVRLPEDMAMWLLTQPDSQAEVLRRLVKEAMERNPRPIIQTASTTKEDHITTPNKD